MPLIYPSLLSFLTPFFLLSYCEPQMKREMLFSTSYFDYFWILIVRQLEVDVIINDDEV